MWVLYDKNDKNKGMIAYVYLHTYLYTSKC